MPVVVLFEGTPGALETLGSIFTQIMTWVTSLVSTIASQPLLLLPVGIFVVGAVIGLASRLIGR